MLLLRITADCTVEDDYGDYRATVDALRYEAVTIDKLLAEMNDWQLQQLGLVRLKLDEKQQLSKIAVDTLKHHGWAHAANAKDRDERKQLEQEFWVLKGHGQGSMFYRSDFAKLDLDNLSDDDLKRLVGGDNIVQKVTPKSVLQSKDYKRYKDLQQKKSDNAKRLAEARKAKVAAKKLKEIEAAKKLLEEAGELNAKVEEKYWAPKDSEIAAAFARADKAK